MSGVLDLLFPRGCVSCGKYGSYLCTECKSKLQIVEHPVCAVCRRQAIGGQTHPICRGKYRLDGLVCAVFYKGPAKALISKLKYKWVSDLGVVLGDLVKDNLWRFNLPEPVVLVPIPLHLRRANWRGFNQADLICDILVRKFKVRRANILKRVIETKTQVGLTKEQRKRNIKEAFALTFKPKKDISYILVDDVYTTGATIGEACKVLKKAGAINVWGLVVALD